MPNLLQYGGHGTSISPSNAPHYANVYDFANQWQNQQATLDNAASISFPYTSSPQQQAATVAAVVASQAASNPANVNAYAYAALAQQAIAAGAPSLAAAYPQ
jgi:hypothetical protein